jgi:hypothetical protein
MEGRPAWQGQGGWEREELMDNVDMKHKNTTKNTWFFSYLME